MPALSDYCVSDHVAFVTCAAAWVHRAGDDWDQLGPWWQHPDQRQPQHSEVRTQSECHGGKRQQVLPQEPGAAPTPIRAAMLKPPSPLLYLVTVDFPHKF